MPDKNSIFSAFISVGLHVAVLGLLLLTLPIPVSSQNDEPDNVQVELVEPETPASSEAQTTDETSAESAPSPQAFESASDSEKENADIEPVTPSDTPAADVSEVVEESAKEKVAPSETAETVLTAEKSDISISVEEKQQAAMQEAKQIYSEGALSDPRVRQAIGQLSPKERVSQICSIEALEQIRHHRSNTPPDMMARKGGQLTETSLKMLGGAYRSHSKWYDLDFQCEIDAAEMKVTSFKYSIGQVVPQNDWVRRGLPVD
ncbi:DUF930 domain-containing protein [Brucellaceae bacterium C25G]